MDKLSTVKNTRENNKLFRECRNKEIPFLAIRGSKQYGFITYDFIASPYELNKPSTEKVKAIFNEIMKDEDYQPKRCNLYMGCGPVSGSSSMLQVEQLQDHYGPLVYNIVMDPDNWEKTGYTLEELESRIRLK